MSGPEDVPPPIPQQAPQSQPQQVPHTMSTVKLPLLKKGEYDIWAMKMEHYLAHTDYPIWEVIQKGNGPVSVTTDTQGVVKVLPPRTAEEILARERERKARTTLLMAIPEDHLAKFHRMTDAKEIWDAVKSRFGGNDESKKMQKYLLKQQFEGFTISNSEGLHKGYDQFQSLLSQLEVHGAGVSNEDANQKFLRCLPSSWSQVSLVMRTKQGIDNLGFDDLYNNLRVFESDIQGSNVSSSNSPNVAFVSSESTNSTNNVSIASGASSSTSHQNTKRESSLSYTDDLMYSFFANQSSGPQLDHDDLEQINEYDLEEMDLNWQVAMISMRLKKFFKKTGRKLHFDAKEPVGFDKTKVECYNCHKTGHFAKECRLKGSQETRRREGGSFRYKVNDNARRSGKKEETSALVTLDNDGIDWSGHAEDEDEDFALMAINNASTEVEAQLATHQSNQLWYEQKIKFMKIDLDDKTDVLTYHKKLLVDALKEKEDLYDGVLSYENEVLQSVFFNNESDRTSNILYERFVKPGGMHVVPSLMTGNYMPSRPDVEIDESLYSYGPKTPLNNESVARDSAVDSCESQPYEQNPDCMPLHVEPEPTVVSTPKVWTDAPIIEEYESDDECDSTLLSDQTQPREIVNENKSYSQNPKANRSRSTRKGLGYGNARKGCYVCGSFSHLIRDCDFHEKRMTKPAAIHKSVNQKEIRPTRNNVHKETQINQFVPSAVLTRYGKISIINARSSSTNQVNTARQNVSTARQNCSAVPTRTANKVSTESTKVNNIKPNHVFNNVHSPSKRSFSRTTATRTNFSNPKVSTAKGKAVSAVGGNVKTAVKASADCIWRPKRYYVNKYSKYNGGSKSRYFYIRKDPLGRPKSAMAWVPKRN
ncbi:ribonuclease H-like domain-containing protein [Tanacetum coccineum]